MKNDLFVAKDFTPQNPARYYPAFAQDLAAVRAHLDAKNDVGELNTSSAYVVGAGEAATPGLLWLAAGWNRPAVHPVLFGGATYQVVPHPGVEVGTEAGGTVAGAVWLSPNRPAAIPEYAVKTWVSRPAPKMPENNPMLFLHGDADARGRRQAGFFHHEVLVAEPRPGSALNRPEQTFLRPVEGAGSLAGANLLGRDSELRTEDAIVKFLSAIRKKRARITHEPRNYSEPYFINLGYFGVAP